MYILPNYDVMAHLKKVRVGIALVAISMTIGFLGLFMRRK